MAIPMRLLHYVRNDGIHIILNEIASASLAMTWVIRNDGVLWLKQKPPSLMKGVWE